MSPTLAISLALGLVAALVYTVVACTAPQAVVQATGTVVGIGALGDLVFLNVVKARLRKR